jgi:hypothetical protein
VLVCNSSRRSTAGAGTAPDARGIHPFVSAELSRRPAWLRDIWRRGTGDCHRPDNHLRRAGRRFRVSLARLVENPGEKSADGAEERSRPEQAVGCLDQRSGTAHGLPRIYGLKDSLDHHGERRGSGDVRGSARLSIELVDSRFTHAKKALRRFRIGNTDSVAAEPASYHLAPNYCGNEERNGNFCNGRCCLFHHKSLRDRIIHRGSRWCAGLQLPLPATLASRSRQL